MTRRTLAVMTVTGLALAGTPPLHADIFRFTVRPQASSINTNLSASTALTGSFIGNFDPVNNPTGTRTIPGLFGGNTNGNFPIPITGTAGFAGSDTSRPTGQFTFNLDTEALTATVAGLNLDMLAGTPLGVTLGLTVQWESFRTRQPTSVFIGGFPVPIPFGQVELSLLTLSQTELTGVGGVTELGTNQYRVTLVAPVTVMAQLDVLGTMQSLGPFTLPLPFQADVTVNGNEATARFTFDASIQQEFPLDVALPENQPIDLPTVLPPGGTAHLLLNASVSGLSIDFTLGASLVADGVRQKRNPADWNNDGIVNSLDFMLFMTDFFLLNADFNRDTRTNSQDFFDFSTAYLSAT